MFLVKKQHAVVYSIPRFLSLTSVVVVFAPHIRLVEALQARQHADESGGHFRRVVPRADGVWDWNRCLIRSYKKLL